MRIILLTQDDPFYLGKNIDYLLSKLPKYATVVATVVFEVSPFGKRESFFEKMKKTYQVFGLGFFINYGLKYLASKINRGYAVPAILDKHRIPLLQLDGNINSKENLQKLKSLSPDLLVSIAGNQIFKQALIDLAPKGCINLHTALLPKYRGLMPSFWVLKNNEKYTGVSVFFVDEGIDSGPILVQNKIEIGNMSQAELITVSKKMGMDAIIESIDKINTGNYQLIANPAEEMTYFSFPTAADVAVFKANGKRFY